MDIEDGWITTTEAGQYLALSPQQIRNLYLAGKLRRQEPYEINTHKTAYYSWKDVQEMRFNSNRVKKRFHMQKLLNVDIPTDWITPREAAEILHVHISTLYMKMKLGTLLYAETGKGTKLKRKLLPKRMVLRHLDDPERIENNNRYIATRYCTRTIRPALTPEEEAEFVEKVWLSAGDAARLLRVTHANLCKFRRTRRLRSWPAPSCWRDARQYCFRYEDVKELRDDPVRLANRARWEKAFSDEALMQRFGADLDKIALAFPPNPIKLDMMIPSKDIW